MINTVTTATDPKLGHDRVLDVPVDDIRPAPENDQLYRPVDVDDPEIVKLAESIQTHGVQEPLPITEDHWIISGHRRYSAAKLAGLDTVPCRVASIHKDADHDKFMQLLRECNRQREKSLDEKLREEVVSCTPEEAHQAVMEFRAQKAQVKVSQIEVAGEKPRCKISDAKMPLLRAIQQVINDREKYWPLSVRQIHYALLNDPPLIHAGKSGSVYRNVQKCYKALDELLVRARLEGMIPIEVIWDETRPVVESNCHRDCQSFIRQELDIFLRGYRRDLMQSQPNHVEILAEKNTIAPILRPVAEEYCISMTVGRGYCSIPPRLEITNRFRASGKDKLVLLMVTDFDPDGEEIAHSMACSLRDDFGIDQLVPVKVALKADQIRQFSLPPRLKAKETSANYKKFVARHGDDVFELEALPPAALQRALRDAIEQVIDIGLLNHEIAQERHDLRFLENARRRVHAAMVGQLDSEVESD
jgi:hypothetical protein